MSGINIYIPITLLILLNTNIFSQSKKETIYLFFDTSSKEKCEIDIEGKGYQLLNKFRKEELGKFIVFKICKEEFLFHKKSNIKDTCSVKDLQNIRIVNLKYLLDSYRNSKPKQFKHHLFDKVYIIEKFSKDKLIKYRVDWKNEMLVIE